MNLKEMSKKKLPKMTKVIRALYSKHPIWVLVWLKAMYEELEERRQKEDVCKEDQQQIEGS